MRRLRTTIIQIVRTVDVQTAEPRVRHICCTNSTRPGRFASGLSHAKFDQLASIVAGILEIIPHAHDDWKMHYHDIKEMFGAAIGANLKKLSFEEPSVTVVEI